MPDQPVSDPQFWRDLAGIARAKADQTIDDVTRHLLLRIAETHERVADRVKQLLPDNEKEK
jgi:predicted Rossmann-fold nucleotide-binding protein